MADRKKPARWRLYHDDPKTFRLARSGVDLIAAQQTRKGDWFWYTLSSGESVNTSGNPVSHFGFVRNQVRDWLKKNG